MTEPAQAIDYGSGAALGLLQGLTEFLPVSSSGHIAIGELLFGLNDAPLALSVLLHGGTLLATLIVFRRDVAELLRQTVRGLREPKAFIVTDNGRLALGIFLASVPTAAIGLALKDGVEAWTHVPLVVGACLLVSAVLVLTTRFTGGESLLPTWRQALIIGLVQGVAVLPGISRSGATIAAAMALGMAPVAAFRFSFLISLPAVFGALLLELRHPGALTSLGPGAFLGGAIALVVGYACLRLLRGVVDRGNLWSFSVYLVPVGIWLLLQP